MGGERTPNQRVARNLPRREEIRQELRELRSWMRNGDITEREYAAELYDRVFELQTLRFDDRPIGESGKNPRAAFGIAPQKP